MLLNYPEIIVSDN